MSRGSALVEILVLGFAVVMAILLTLVTAGRLQAAGEAATEAAQVAATHAARSGDATDAARVLARLAPASGHEIHVDDTVARVVVRTRVPVLGPAGGVQLTVTGRAEVAVSPYLSRP